MTFAERIGGILVAPRATLATLTANAEGGRGDVAVLLGLRLLAAETPRLGRAVIGLPGHGLGGLLRGLLQAIATLVPEVAAILLGSLVLSLFAGPRAAAGERMEARADAPLDFAAYSYVPYLTVTTLVVLVDTALQRSPGGVEKIVANTVGLGWSGALLLLALGALRRQRRTS